MENNSSFSLKGISSGECLDKTFLTIQDAPQLQAQDQIPPLEPWESEKATVVVQYQGKAGGIAACSESGVVTSLDLSRKAVLIKLKGYIKVRIINKKKKVFH